MKVKERNVSKEESALPLLSNASPYASTDCHEGSVSVSDT